MFKRSSIAHRSVSVSEYQRDRASKKIQEKNVDAESVLFFFISLLGYVGILMSFTDAFDLFPLSVHVILSKQR